MIETWTHTYPGLERELPRMRAFVERTAPASPNHDPRWLQVLAAGLHQCAYCIEAFRGERTLALLPLLHVRSLLFGRHLVSLPYLNVGGVLAEDPMAATVVVDRAIALSDELRVRHLELRHEQALAHPRLITPEPARVHMRRGLPDSADELWQSLDGKVRNQIRKGERQGFDITWGGMEQVGAFHDVYSANMRDLGTPHFGAELFRQILKYLGDKAEIVVLRHHRLPIAGALLIHGHRMSEVPTAGSLTRYRPTNANMLMYWHLLKRTIERGQHFFDFGRSQPDSSTFRFKEQWGASPEPATWQYYVREGDVHGMRRENPRFQRAIALWRRLPLGLARLLGPWIARGIP